MDGAASNRLARLAARYGPETGLNDLLDRLAADCPWRRRPGQRRAGKYDPKCHACYAELIHKPATGPATMIVSAGPPLTLVQDNCTYLVLRVWKAGGGAVAGA